MKLTDLYPTFEPVHIFEPEEQGEHIYKPSCYFDFKTGDFLLDEAGRIVTADEKQAWLQWCMKVVNTQSAAYLAYSSSLGVDREGAMSAGGHAEQESALELAITDALLADPYHRTMFVRDFIFEWHTNCVNLSFTVVGTGGEATIELEMNRG